MRVNCFPLDSFCFCPDSVFYQIIFNQIVASVFSDNYVSTKWSAFGPMLFTLHPIVSVSHIGFNQKHLCLCGIVCLWQMGRYPNLLVSPMPILAQWVSDCLVFKKLLWIKRRREQFPWCWREEGKELVQQVAEEREDSSSNRRTGFLWKRQDIGVRECFLREKNGHPNGGDGLFPPPGGNLDEDV